MRLLKIFYALLMFSISIPVCVHAEPGAFGIDILNLGLDDSNSNSIGDIAIDTDQLECDPVTHDLERFFPTQLIAEISNTTSYSVLVRFARIRIREANTGKLVWRSRKLQGSYTSVPSGVTGSFITVLATPKDGGKVFIGSDIYLGSHKTALNAKVTMLIETPAGKIRKRANILLVPTSLNYC